MACDGERGAKAFAVQKQLACRALAQPEDGFHDFRPSRPDEAAQTEDLAAMQIERRRPAPTAAR